MKRFLKTILLLLGILFVLNAVLDVGFTHSFRHSRSMMYNAWNRIIYDTIDADVLVMGSSRAWVQYDPRIMDSLLSVNSYNLGLNGSHVRRQIVKYKVYCHYQQKKPSLLIVNLDYYGNWGKDGGEGGYQREQYFPYLANPYMRKLIREQEPFGIGELYVPMYRYYSQGILTVFDEITGINAEDDREHWYKGYYSGMPQEWDGSRLADIETIHFEPLPEVVEKFDAFLSELQKDDVNVIFVCSPIYFGTTEKVDNLSDFYDFRDHFSEKYGISVLDYFQAPFCYDTAYFYNATHLNKTGAELFTTKLCHDLDSLGIISKQPL